MTAAQRPRIVVLSTLFPHPGQPTAGVFIRERMIRVAAHLPVTVIAPVPWFPLQGLVRRWRPHFRPPAPREQAQDGLRVLHPRFLCVPAVLKCLDGFFMALGSLATLRRLRREQGVDLIDAHFGYPDGHAACLLSRWSGIPFTVTLRGTEPRLGRTRLRGALMRSALAEAARLIAVSTSLGDWARRQGIDAGRVEIIGNGVDTSRFAPSDRVQARAELGETGSGPIIVTVGGLTERKGFHRVIECLPELHRKWNGLRYLVVGGASAEGDWRARLEEQVSRLGLRDVVRFLGVVPPDRLRVPLSAADAFVLATRNEGWANVLLEAMACGLPVVTTDVGGNRQVVADDGVGIIVPFDDPSALTSAIEQALVRAWDRPGIRAYAQANSWESRLDRLVPLLREASGCSGGHVSGVTTQAAR